MPKSKVSAFFSVVLVFVSGVAMGAVGYRLYTVKAAMAPSVANAAPKKSPEEVRKLILGSLKDKVKLDDAQTQQVKKIYEDQFAEFTQIRNRYQSVIDKAHADSRRDSEQLHDADVAKIKALLRPDQQELYAQWQADRAAAQAKRKQQQQQEHDKHDHPDGRQRPLPPFPPLP